MSDTHSLVILNLFRNPAGLGALSREILKPIQDDDLLLHDGAVWNGF
ncbi:hypothetical protein [Parasphingorhabdus sp.]